MITDYKTFNENDNILIYTLLGDLKSRQRVQIEVSDKVIRGFTAYEVRKLLELKERYLYEFQVAHVVYIEAYENCIRIIGELPENERV